MAAVSYVDELMSEDEERSAEEQTERLRILDSLGNAISKARSMAIQARFDSGIEEQWLEDEMFYQGVDELSSATTPGWAIRKPRDSRGTGDDADTQGDGGSTVFPNITRPYCDAAAARMGDMLLPTDDRAFAILPTPVPDLIMIAKEGKLPPMMEKDARAEAAGDEEAYSRMRERIMAAAKEKLTQAKDAADRAQTQVDDWFTEATFHTEAREVIGDATKSGTGVLKGPIPVSEKRVAWRNGELLIENRIKPVSRRVDFWNCYPGAGSGRNIQDADHHFERDDIGRRAVEKLIGVDGYIDAQLRAVLREKPHKATREYSAKDELGVMTGLTPRDTSELFEIWYVYSRITKEELLACEIECNSGDPEIEDRESYDVVLEIINNRVVKATLNLLSTGSYPYDYMVYQQLPGLPWGVGVARHIRVAQRILVAAIRNMMDNAGLAGGPMWWVHMGVLSPIDGTVGIAPRKGWYASDKAPLEHIENAIGYVNMDPQQTMLQAIVELALRFAEESTGLPMILQGQQGDSTRTLGGMQMLNNNASTVLRRIARLFDDLVTEPHVGRYYEWLLLYGEDDQAKGDFVIDARGSSALVERELQSQGIGAMGQIVGDPKFGLDPKKWAEQWVKSQRLNYEDLRFTDDEWKKLVESLTAMAQKGDTRLEVAKLQADAKAAEGDKERQMTQALEAMKYEHAQEQNQFMMALRALDDETNNTGMLFEKDKQNTDIKARIAELVMKLQTQIDLSNRRPGGREAASPPTEPAGRAPVGQSYAA